MHAFPYHRHGELQILMVLADHGPAVSGAHNTIVTARAGKDLVSSVVSGLLTVGPRFGGALDGAHPLAESELARSPPPPPPRARCTPGNRVWVHQRLG